MTAPSPATIAEDLRRRLVRCASLAASIGRGGVQDADLGQSLLHDLQVCIAHWNRLHRPARWCRRRTATGVRHE